MSTVKTNNVQIGQSVTATNNFTWYQPSTPDGTVRLGVGNSGATSSDVVTVNSSGNVGIGTSSPSSKLHVVGSSYVLGKFIRDNTATASGGVQVGNNSQVFTIYADTVGLSFENTTSGTTPLVLNPSGNLGLGVTPANWGTTFKAIELPGGVAFASYGTSGDTNIFCNAIYNNSVGQYQYKSNGAAGYFEMSQNVYKWYNAPSGTAGTAISFTPVSYTHLTLPTILLV